MVRKHRSSRRSGKTAAIIRDAFIRILEFRFEVLKDKSRGMAVIEYEYHRKDYDAETHKTGLPLISLWVDDRGAQLECVKAHLRVDHRVVSQMKFFRLLLNEGMIQDRRDRDFCITADTAGKGIRDVSGIIRFGRRSESPYSKYRDGDWSSDSMYTIYDSKGKALYDLMSQIDKNIQLAGLRLISLANIPDEVLLEIGYEKVPDLFGRGADMWCGNPHKILKSGDSSYGYGGVTAVYRKNAQSFLDILKKHWQISEQGAA